MQLIIAAAASQVGAALIPAGIAGVSGASIGWLAGSLIASAFAPTQKSYGPRLADTRVQGSTLGAIIPWVAGTPRVAGNVVWASSIREIATTTEQGGKGGGGAEHTSYTYEVDLLLVLTENTVPGISRIWKYGELSWNKGPTADAATIVASDATDKWSRVTFYDGNASQMPDPDYEAAAGPDVPAYRGRTTVFYKDVALGNSHAIPQFTHELSQTVPGVEVSTHLNIGTANDIVRAVALGEDHIMIAQSKSGDGVYIKLYNMAGAAPVEVANTLYVADANSRHGELVAVDDTRAVLIYKRPADARASAVMIGRSGDALVGGLNTVMFPSGSGAAAGSLLCGAKIDSGAIIGITNTSGSTISSQVVTCSGMTILAVGSPQVSATLPGGSGSGFKVTGLVGSALFTCATGVDLRAWPASVSGTTVTYGTISDPYDPGLASNVGPLGASASSLVTSLRKTSSSAARAFFTNGSGGTAHPVTMTATGGSTAGASVMDAAIYDFAGYDWNFDRSSGLFLYKTKSAQPGPWAVYAKQMNAAGLLVGTATELYSDASTPANLGTAHAVSLSSTKAGAVYSLASNWQIRKLTMTV